MKVDLTKFTRLSEIIYHIGYYFYKVKGIYLEFDVKGKNVYAIREDKKKMIIFKIKNNCICKINDYLLKLFDFPITEIITTNWEEYIVEG